MTCACTEAEQGMGIRLLALSQATGLLTVSVVGNTATLTVQTADGYYWYRFWLSDSATDSTKTLTPPSGGVTEWEGITNSSGVATITITNTDPSRTWYLWGIVVKANVSDAITVGV